MRVNFNLIDKTKVTTININLRKVRIVSSHPKDSYEIVYDESDMTRHRTILFRLVDLDSVAKPGLFTSTGFRDRLSEAFREEADIPIRILYIDTKMI